MMLKVGIAIFISQLAFADVASLDFDLTSLPRLAVVSSATLSVSESSDIEVFTYGNVFSPAGSNGCVSSLLLQTVPCPGNPFTNVGYVNWTFCCMGPYYLVNSAYDVEVSGPGFLFPASFNPFSEVIDPGLIHGGGTYQASVSPTLYPGSFACITTGDDYCSVASGGGNGTPPGGKVPVPTLYYQVGGTAVGTLDVEYSVGDVAHSTDFSATTSWSYATPEPGYTILLFAAVSAMIGWRARRRHATRKV